VPDDARDQYRGEDCGGGRYSGPVEEPAATGYGFFGNAGTDARQEGGRNFGVDGLVKAGVYGGEVELLFRERGAASGAGGEMGAQFRLRLGTGGGGLD
jgi:hypothetical protein